MKANEFIIAPENAGKSIVEIMQLYSDQQNKEKDAEIQRLKERNKYLEEHSNERFEQANELNDQDQEIQRLTNSYNTCAENFAALQVRFGEEAAKVTRLTKELQEAKTSDGRGWKAVERLTKKVEELKKQVNGWAHTAGTYQNEITRLRELLKKCEPIVSRYVDRILVTREEQRIIRDKNDSWASIKYRVEVQTRHPHPR